MSAYSLLKCGGNQLYNSFPEVHYTFEDMCFGNHYM